MRHAEAGEADPGRWPDDRQRPLTEAGRREHAIVAGALQRMGVRFERLLTSPLVRARETAEITARAFGGRPAPEPTELLGDRAEPASTLAGLAGLEEDIEDLAEPVADITRFDECMFTVGVRSAGGYRFRDRRGTVRRRSALAFDMGGGLPQRDLIAFPGEEPPQIECNEDAGGQDTEE